MAKPKAFYFVSCSGGHSQIAAANRIVESFQSPFILPILPSYISSKVLTPKQTHTKWHTKALLTDGQYTHGIS
jgi:hypothetical protein